LRKKERVSEIEKKIEKTLDSLGGVYYKKRILEKLNYYSSTAGGRMIFPCSP